MMGPEERDLRARLHAQVRRMELDLTNARSAEGRARAAAAMRAALARLKGEDRPGRPLTANRAALREEAQWQRAEGRSIRAISDALGVAQAKVHA